MISRKLIIVDKGIAILSRDVYLNGNFECNVFDSEEKLLEFSKDKYFARNMEIALIEGEVYDNKLRDIKEVCGFRKDLQEELFKIKDFEFKQMMRVVNELTNRAEELESKALNV